MIGRTAISDFVVKESHLDTFGHMNNATYLQVFEQVRWDLISQKGYGIPEIREKGFGPVILEVQIRFKKELKLRQHVKIETTLLSYEGRVGTLLQEMKNDAGESCCTAEIKLGYFDIRARKLVPPSPEWLAAIGFEKS
jgi:acyl-CoA thioester hydrolase